MSFERDCILFKVLLDNGADPHCAAESYSHTTPMMAAASAGKVEVVRVMLKWLLKEEGIEGGLLSVLLPSRSSTFLSS